MDLGSKAIDNRTTLGKALAKWRADLIQDLGGDVSTQQAALVDLAVKSKLLLDSIDTWLFTQKSLVNAKKKALLPVVRERQTLADGLARYLAQLGLHRKIKSTSIGDLLNEAAEEHEAPGEQRQAMTSFDSEPLTTSEGHSGTCLNPFCNSIIEPLPNGGWRRTERRYCCDRCKTDGYVLRRVRAMIDEVGIIEFNSRLQAVKP